MKFALDLPPPIYAGIATGLRACERYDHGRGSGLFVLGLAGHFPSEALMSRPQARSKIFPQSSYRTRLTIVARNGRERLHRKYGAPWSSSADCDGSRQLPSGRLWTP